ncbi:MAG: DUF5067 domain-containing protein [Lachnospiraceae bacterium]|nr:DUF5067 domain-containing protein [Lachnospiraceae bacterium]
MADNKSQGKKMVRRKLTPEEIKARKKQNKNNKKQGSTIDFSVGEDVLDNNLSTHTDASGNSDAGASIGSTGAHTKDTGGLGQESSNKPLKTKSGKTFVKTEDMNNPARKFNKDKAERNRAEKSREERDLEDINYYSRDIRKERKDQQFRVFSVIVFCVEITVFVILLWVLIHFVTKLNNKDFDLDNATEAGEETAESADGSANGNSVNVDNERFSLTCTKVGLTDDSDGNPAALIYFSFVNKTSEPLALSEVFAPIVTQDGQSCETFASIAEPPEEFYNKDVKVSEGTPIDACYSVKLYNKESPLSLTIHDNYETFSDIGTTIIPLK